MIAHDAYGYWQRRRKQTAEHPHQDQETERERDGFHQQQVTFCLGVDLHGGHRRAADADRDAVAVMTQPLGQCLRVLLAVGTPAGDAGDERALTCRPC